VLIVNEDGNRIDDSFYGVTTNTRNTIKENDVWTYFTDRNGLGDIIQKSNENEAHLFEYRGDKRLSKYTHIQNNIETNNTTYYWDALGRRVAKEIQTPTQTFTNVFAHEGDQDKILLSRNGNGDEYLNIDGQGIDEHLAKITPTEVKSYVTNHLGTVLNSEATDSAKATGAFGEILQSVNTVNSSTAPVVYSLTGREFDLESSTYFFRNRQYDQDSGKFLSSDPIHFKGGDLNLYRYVFNSPARFTDSLGLLIDDRAGVIGLLLETGNEEILRMLNELQQSPIYIPIINVNDLRDENGQSLYGQADTPSLPTGTVRVDIDVQRNLNSERGIVELADTTLHELIHVQNAINDYLQGAAFYDYEEQFTRNRTTKIIGSGNLACEQL
jgi:RHS repeat-associated protein